MSLSVYVHIPFCSRRCDYCDFATWVDKDDLVEKYINTVITQWKYHCRDLDKNSPLTSIFFGGGTPNLIDANYISKIIEQISQHCAVTNDTEITVESNPDHVTLEKMKIYARAGVNRISMGIQSTNLEVLKYLGREHNPDHVKTSREIVHKAGIQNVSGDLIYGSGVETVEMWSQTLQDTISLDLNHISAYALGIEKATPLGKAVESNEKPATDDDDLADKYELAEKMLNENGFSWYEISNWSKPNYESKHNLTYWRGGDVVALGCAAHGFTNSNRWSTPRNIDVYMEKFSSPIDPSMFLDRNDNKTISRELEDFSLKLRTKHGVRWPSRTLTAPLNELIEANLIEYCITKSTISLSVKGRLMANALSLELFREYEQSRDVVE